jgi:hypothetical protein
MPAQSTGDMPSSTPAASSTAATTEWHWLLIAALAALVVFQFIDAPAGKNRR